MASDDNQSDEPALPADVERALAKARAQAASAGSAAATNKSSRWLAAIPLTAGALMMLLMMPRAAPPEDVPLPRIDQSALDGIRKNDADRAASARTVRLSGGVLLVGSKVRELNKAQVSNTQVGAPSEEIGAARQALDQAVRLVLADGPSGYDALRSLRAVQLEGFLAEVERFEATGKSSQELEELGGGFVDRMASAGWLHGTKVALDDAARRTAFKLVWNAQVGGDRVPDLALGLDEQRALYTFYLEHPHAPESQRIAYENQRIAASDPVACKKAILEENLDVEQWRIEKIKRLGELDATYPTSFALGVAYYRAGRFDLSVEAFQSWLAKHPDGPLALRARNHMKAALAAFGPS